MTLGPVVRGQLCQQAAREHVAAIRPLVPEDAVEEQVIAYALMHAQER